MTEKLLRKLMHSFEVHSNESVCRKSGRLGLKHIKGYVLATVKVVGGNRTHTHTNTKVRDPNKSYFEGLNNI